MGLDLEFKCKNCNKEQVHQVTGTSIYEINEIKNVDYVPLECSNCSKTHFIATDVTVVNSMSEEDIELAYESKIAELFGKNSDYDKNREYIDGKLNIITIDKVVLSVDEVRCKEQVGTAMY